MILEKRSVMNASNAVLNLRLEEAVRVYSYAKQTSMSRNGKYLAIGAGRRKAYIYLVDIEKRIQHKLTACHLKHSFVPCFISGEVEFVAAAAKGKVEIWDVNTKKTIRMLPSGGMFICCMSSTNNILATGGDEQTLRLWDVRSWELFHSSKYQMQPTSLHLTEDSKFLTIGGWLGERCVVLQIK